MKIKMELSQQNINGEEWPSGLRCYNVNQKHPGLNPTRCLAGLWDPTAYKVHGELWVQSD